MFALEDNNTSRRRPLRVAVAVASALVLAGVSAIALRHGPSPKPEVLVPQTTTPVGCGQLIMVSIVVGNDLTCPSGDGLVVGHASITINLNGRTLAGNGSSRGINGQGFATVTIENGTVSGWFDGVFAGGPTNKVIGIRAHSNTEGIRLEGTGSSATGNVVFSNASLGIVLAANTEKVMSNAIRDTNGFGIYVGGSGDFVQTNQVENGTGPGIWDVGSGTTISGNVANGNGGQGIASGADPTATIATNTANYNGTYGIDASPGGKDGGGNLAKGNAQAAQCKNLVCS